jgi:hypothetical protein
MPTTLKGSCRCGAVRFRLDSQTPRPYQRCYCTVCRKTAGGGGFAINIMGLAASLKVRGKRALEQYHARIAMTEGRCAPSEAARHFCRDCDTALWLFTPEYPDLLCPFASAIDTDPPVPPSRVHLLLAFKASWVEPQIGAEDNCFDLFPALSIEDWHRRHGLWID